MASIMIGGGLTLDVVENSNEPSNESSNEPSIMRSCTNELPTDDEILLQLKKDGFTLLDVKLLGMYLQIPDVDIDEVMAKDSEDAAMKGVHMYNAWKQSAIEERNLETLLKALEKMGKTRTSRAFSNSNRRRASTIQDLTQEDVWPKVADFSEEQAKIFALTLGESINDFDKELYEKQHGHSGLVAYGYFRKWKNKLTFSGSAEGNFLKSALKKAQLTASSGIRAGNNPKPPDQVVIENTKQQQPGQTEQQQHQQGENHNTKQSCSGHSVLALSGIVLTAIILASASIGLLSYVVRMIDQPIYPEKSKIYPIFGGDTIRIPIRSTPPYIDVELIGGFIDIGRAADCSASIIIIAADHVEYSNSSTLINPPLDNIYLAEGSSVLISSNDVRIISGKLDVWLFSTYEKLNAALEDSFGNVVNPEIDHDCHNPSEDVLCETISSISPRPLKFSIDKPSYYSMRCAPDKQFNCSNTLHKWTYNKVDYLFDNESAIYYNINTNGGTKRIDLKKSPIALAQLSDECDNFYFIIVHYPTQHHKIKLYLALAFIGLPVIILLAIVVVVIYLWCKFRA